jgi:hypothetical protein
VLGFEQDLFHRAILDDVALMHHDDAIGDVPRRAELVRDDERQDARRSRCAAGDRRANADLSVVVALDPLDADSASARASGNLIRGGVSERPKVHHSK